jgi:hypothetical protein
VADHPIAAGRTKFLKRDLENSNPGHQGSVKHLWAYLVDRRERWRSRAWIDWSSWARQWLGERRSPIGSVGLCTQRQRCIAFSYVAGNALYILVTDLARSVRLAPSDKCHYCLPIL